jgi:hypothetical protein
MNEKKGLFKKIKAAVSPQSMMGNLASALLPQLAASLMAMEQPEAEGGVLKAGEQKIGFLITQGDGEISLSIVAMRYDPELQAMVMGKPIKTFAGNEAILELQNQIG